MIDSAEVAALYSLQYYRPDTYLTKYGKVGCRFEEAANAALGEPKARYEMLHNGLPPTHHRARSLNPGEANRLPFWLHRRLVAPNQHRQLLLKVEPSPPMFRIMLSTGKGAIDGGAADAEKGSN